MGRNRSCRYCGTPIPPHNRFCGGCGAPVGAEPESYAFEQVAERSFPWLELGLIVVFGVVAIVLGIFAFIVVQPFLGGGGPSPATQVAASASPEPTQVQPTSIPGQATNAPSATSPAASPTALAQVIPTLPAASPTRPPATSVASGGYRVVGLRYALHPDRARLVLDLQGPENATPPTYEIATANGRVTIKLGLATAASALDPDDRLVKSIDLRATGERAATLDVEAKSPVKVTDYVLKDPARLAFDLVP